MEYKILKIAISTVLQRSQSAAGRAECLNSEFLKNSIISLMTRTRDISFVITGKGNPLLPSGYCRNVADPEQAF